jgi:hypothetical protein
MRKCCRSNLLVLFIVFSLSSLTGLAQSMAFINDADRESVTGLHDLSVRDTVKEFDPFIPDSLQITEKPKLLPDKISFAENMLWGENGLTRKIGLTGDLTPETRKNELQVRRTMLTAHQIGGFATLGLMIASAYVGQTVIDGRRDLGDTHKSLVGATILTYSLTGLLAILSPPPSIRRDDFSTTTLHKTLAWAHVAGMIITPILGSYIQSHRTFNMDKAHVHQLSGYITTALFATSLIVITF